MGERKSYERKLQESEQENDWSLGSIVVCVAQLGLAKDVRVWLRTLLVPHVCHFV